MRKIVVEFTLPEECEKDYVNDSAEKIIADFWGIDLGMRILSDVVITEKGETNILVKNI